MEKLFIISFVFGTVETMRILLEVCKLYSGDSFQHAEGNDNGLIFKFLL